MTGPKLTAMILFGALSFVFGLLFAGPIVGAFGGLVTAFIVAVGTAALIYFAETGKQAFARGFLALGAVFIVVPVVGLAGLGEQVADVAVQAIEGENAVSEEEFGAIAVTSIFATAGLAFGFIVGLILVLIGGLMHRRPSTAAQLHQPSAATPPPPVPPTETGPNDDRTA